MFDSDESSHHQTLLDVLQRRATRQPDDEAFTFLLDGETQEQSITYSELYRRSRAIGAQLQAIGGIGERALILCPPGLDYIAAFFGCICSGWAAVPLYAPNLSAHSETIRIVVESAQPRACIMTSAMLSDNWQPELADLHLLMADKTPRGIEEQWHAPDLDADSLAYLIYTSGSTSTPKGVAVAHRNLRLIPMETFRHDGTHRYRVVNWMSPQVTTAITMGFVLPICAGIPSTHMSLEAFLERPARWIEVMSRTRATQTSAPNFAYDLAVEAIAPEDRARLDLSCWEYAFNGGEHIRAETVERFETAFAVSGLRPGTMRSNYGLTEAARIANARHLTHLTIISFDREQLEAGRVVPVLDGDKGGRTLVGLGTLGSDVEVRIVDPDSRKPCGADEIGEIWTAGPHVAQGYWNAPEATRDTFGAYLAGDPEVSPGAGSTRTGTAGSGPHEPMTNDQRPTTNDPKAGAGPYFRTGDLGFLYRNELFIAGRLKDVLVVRGRNIHATDVELAARRGNATLHSRTTAAFTVEYGGEEQIVIVQETRAKVDTFRIASSIRRAVATELGVQPHTVALAPFGAIPRTSGGKVRRIACRTAFLAGTLPLLYVNDRFEWAHAQSVPYVPATTTLEQEIVSIWENVLGVQPIGIHDEFVQLGGDSLQSVQVMARMREHGLNVSTQTLHRNGTVAVLARALSQGQSPPHDRGSPAADEGPIVGPVPMLLMQYGVLGDREELPTDLVVVELLTSMRPLAADLMERVARALVFHHDALRMRFLYTGQGWEAECVAHTPAKIVFFHDLSHLPHREHAARMLQEEQRLRGLIDIRRGINLQIAVFHRGAGIPDHVLLIFPHLVYDALSLPILIGDLETAYLQAHDQAHDDEPIHFPAKTTSIREWGERLRELVASGEMQTEVQYWLDMLRGGPTRLPPDATADAPGEGGITDVWTDLEPEPTQLLMRSAPSRHGFRIIDALLHATAHAVADRTHSASVLIDVWGHGRELLSPDMDLSRTLGYFTTQFPVRVNLEGSGGPLDGLARLHRQLKAMPRHGIGFDALRYLCTDALCDGIRVPDRPIRVNFYGEPDSRFRGLTLFTRQDPNAPDEADAPVVQGHVSSEADAQQPVIFRAAPTDLLDIASFIENGKLRIRVNYHTHVYQRSTIEAFAASIREELSQIAALCEPTHHHSAHA